MDEPCGLWPLDPSCLPDDWSADPSQWTPEQRSAVQEATEILWRLTAGRYGLCEELLRPCRRDCTPDGYGTTPLWGPGAGGWMQPVLWNGTWVNVTCGCGRGDDCSCTQLCEVRLPEPVARINAVLVDGQTVPPAAYRVDNDRLLVRTDGGCWPWCQDLARPDTEPGTWSVRYMRGREVPVGGRRAVTALAIELHKACVNKGRGCRLPGNVITVDREGLSYRIDPEKVNKAGKVGLPEVDRWLSAVNPYGHRTPPAVYTPDLPQQRSMATDGSPLRITWEPQ